MKKNYLTFLLILLNIINIGSSFAQNCVDATIQITTSIQSNPTSITFSWLPITGSTGIYIYRKAKLSSSWGNPLATLPGTATTYTDNTVVLGKDYEYRIYSNGAVQANTYIYAGIKFPQVDNRGKIIFLVDNSFTNSLATELKRLESDMIGDGWQVIRHGVSRTDSPPNIKAMIMADYNADPQNVKAVFLFGHIPVPYSGNFSPDGHQPDHKGAWPADSYYADMTGIWTDTQVNNVSAARTQNQNTIGDGKFDQSYNPFPGLIELQIGRVDLSNMGTSFSLTEEQLLRQYLNKDHNYRHKVFNAQRRALIDDNFGYSGGAFASSGWRNFTAMFPPSDVQAGDYFTDMATQSYLWSYGCGGGTYTSCAGVGSNSDFVSTSPKSVFTMLLGSYFGDWDAEGSFLRAPLASAGWGLTCSWSGRPYSLYHHMALGDNIGYSALVTMRNSSTYIYSSQQQGVHIALMGDPTLRMHTLAPPMNVVTATNPNLSLINLNWTASVDNVLGYCIYRKDTVAGIYNRINNGIITGTNYVDSFPSNGTNYYLVRALKLETSNSGSYYNLSQGAFVQTALVPVLAAPIAAPATNVACHSMTANWSAVSGAFAYHLDVSTDGTFSTLLPGYYHLDVGNATTYNVSGLPGSAVFYYRVRAKAGNNTSVFSNSVTVNPPVPNAPTASPATSLTCISKKANWNTVAGATTYYIDVSTSVTFSTFVIGYDNLNVGNTVSYGLGLTPNITYYYRIRASNDCRSSLNSNTITIPPATPIAPTASPATNRTCISMNANWGGVAGAFTYYLDVSTSSTFNIFVTGYNNLNVGNVVSFNLSALNPNITYYYRVRAGNGCGSSLNSNTIASLAVAPPPFVFFSFNSTCISFQADWTIVTGAIAYYLDVSTSSTFSTFVTGYNNLNVGNVVNYNVTGLTANTTYLYRVRVGNSCGISLNSNMGIVTTVCSKSMLANEKPIVEGSDQNQEMSINDKEERTMPVKIYPNPSNGTVTVELESLQTEFVTIKVYNLLGEVVALIDENEVGTLNTINLAAQKSGTYIVKVVRSDGEIINKKLVLIND